MESTTPPTRYLTLPDYLRVLRRYAIPIVLIAIIGAAAGYVTAKDQTPQYQASALVSFQDPGQNLTLVGLAPGLMQPPATWAAEQAETLTRPAVVAQAQRTLGHAGRIGSHSSSVSGQVSSAGLLEVNATASDPRFAAQLANAVASAVVTETNAQVRSSFASAVSDIRSQVAKLRPRPPTQSTNTQLGVYEEELARLEPLSKSAQAGRVVQAAAAPTSPSSHTLRSTLIGLGLGLLLAILIAFLLDSLDRRIRSAKDVQESFELPILAHVRRRALGRLIHPAGGNQRGSDVDVEAFGILRRNVELLNPESPPRTIVVTSAVAEEGKTTVASSLALAQCAVGKRTLLVDADFRQRSLASRFGVENVPGLSEYLAGDASPQQILRPVPLRLGDASEGGTSSNGGATTNGGANGSAAALVVIPAGSPSPNPVELLVSSRFRDFLRQVPERYDVVIIDTSPLLPVVDTLEILPYVEAVVLCARNAKTTQAEAAAATAMVARFPSVHAGVAITGTRGVATDYASHYRSYGSSKIRSDVTSLSN